MANQCHRLARSPRQLAVGRVKRLGGRGEASRLVSGVFGLLELAVWNGLDARASTLTYETLVDHGHLASFGLPSWQGPGAKLATA